MWLYALAIACVALLAVCGFLLLCIVHLLRQLRDADEDIERWRTRHWDGRNK